MTTTVDTIALLETLDAVGMAAGVGMWDQNEWFCGADTPTLMLADREFCGTVACFAGWRGLLDGGVRVLVLDNFGDPLEVLSFPDGTKVHRGDLGHWAAKRLGLTTQQAAVLFDGTNTLEDLRAAVVALIEGPDAWREFVNEWVLARPEDEDEDEDADADALDAALV